MNGDDRFVVLGLAPPRTAWFSDLGRWSTAGVLALDFVKTVSADELRAHLRSGRRFSAVVIDGRSSGLDRDLIGDAIDRSCAPIIVGDDPPLWRSLGAVASIGPDFGPDDLAAVLTAHARPISRRRMSVAQPADTRTGGARSPLVVVVGGGGVGASSIAMAAAQGFAETMDTVLADLTVDGGHAVLHDVGDIVPGLLDLVEAHRNGTPADAAVRALTHLDRDRGHSLLLGLPRPQDWTALRPRALAASIDGLRRCFDVVIAEVDADLQGEAETGSADVGDRNRLARWTTREADVVVAVGRGGLSGVHGALRRLDRLRTHGVPAVRIVPVYNQIRGRRRDRRELLAAHRCLTSSADAVTGADIVDPVLIPNDRRVERAIRDNGPLPRSIVAPVHRAISVALDIVRTSEVPPDADAWDEPEPVPVAPGSLGSFTG